MPEPVPEAGVHTITEANGSAPSKDSDLKASTVNKHGEETKSEEELNAVKENSGAAEMKDGEEKSGAEGVKEEEMIGGDEEMKEEKDKHDMKELNVVEETKGIEDTRTVNKVNVVEETKEGEEKSGLKDINDEKLLKKLEETTQEEENKGASKMKVEDEQVFVKDRMRGIEKEDLEEKKGAEAKMDMEKAIEDKVEGKGAKEAEGVGMEKVEDVKIEERVRTNAKEEIEGEIVEEKDHMKGKVGERNSEEDIDDNKEAKWSTKKRSRTGRKIGMKGEAKEKKEEIKKAVEAKEKNESGKKSGEAKEKNGSANKDKESLSSPIPFPAERPVRERKTVERLVEVIDKEANKPFVVEKGRGIPLKDIPNVARKLARKKPEDLKLLHHILFGRKGKTIDFKNHILQFSGFAWHGSDDKQRARIKERLDKHVKDTILDFCDLLDISVLKSNTRKEDLIVNLLDFLVAPHVSTEALHADKEQQTPKPQKLKNVAKGSASKSTEDKVAKHSRNKRLMSDNTPSSKDKSRINSEDERDDEEEEENRNSVHAEDLENEHSESEKVHESKHADGQEDKGDDKHSGKGKQGKKRSLEQRYSEKKEKPKAGNSSKKTTSVTTAKSPNRTPSSTRETSDERNDAGEKVFSRRKKIVDTPKKKSTSKQDVKEKSSGKRSSVGKAKSEDAVPSNPSKEDLRKTVCELLKKVDFEKATVSDIVKQLGAHYKVDLTPRKKFIKGMLKEELEKLAEENEDDEDEDEELLLPAGKKARV